VGGGVFLNMKKVFFTESDLIIFCLYKNLETCGLQISGLDFDEIYKGLKIDRTGWGVEPVKTFTPGTRAGLCNLEEFCAKRIKEYGAKRNDPNVSALSNLSPWVNNGQVKF